MGYRRYGRRAGDGKNLRKYLAGEMTEDELMSEVIVNYKKN